MDDGLSQSNRAMMRRTWNFLSVGQRRGDCAPDVLQPRSGAILLMSNHLLISRESRPKWRAEFDAAVTRLTRLPEGSDPWSAHQPKASTIDLARRIAEKITKRDLPPPFVAAGSDGAIQIKWQKNHASEVSFFVEPDMKIEYLLVRKGEVSDGEVRADQMNRINDFIEAIFG